MNEEIIEYPISDCIDLHTFQPKEVKNLLEDYLTECVSRGIIEVRIIHGKGKGVLRNIVHSFLKKSPLVKEFRTVSETSGGWGATLAVLKGPEQKGEN